MFPTVGDMLQCRNGQITACKKLLHFESIWEQCCLLEFYLKEKKKLLFLVEAVGYFCTQENGDTRINELNSGAFKNNFSAATYMQPRVQKKADRKI